MTKGLRTAGVALLFLAASLALAVFAASLLGLPARDLTAVAATMSGSNCRSRATRARASASSLSVLYEELETTFSRRGLQTTTS